MIKIATWNVNSLRVRLPQVINWLESEQPDILALQETKLVDEQFPIDDLAAAGYHAVFSGQKNYNGVAILARQQPEQIVTDFEHEPDPQRRLLLATIAGIRIVNVYIPNGSSLGSDKYPYKLDWLQRLTTLLSSELQQHQQLIVLGDFNIAPSDEDVHDPAAWQDCVLTSPAEREALDSILSLGLDDVFRQFDQEKDNFSWWDYRQAAFRRNLGLRIDLILASKALSSSCQNCHIDKTPRSWERPSDHAPVIAVFDG